MLIDSKQLAETYKQLRARSGAAQGSVLVMVANDVDSLCAARIFQVRISNYGPLCGEPSVSFLVA